jgi:flagellar protein FlbD
MSDILYYNLTVSGQSRRELTVVIELTKLKGEKFALNSDHIEIMEETPDTVITLLNGHKYVVRERLADVISLIESFKRRVLALPLSADRRGM